MNILGQEYKVKLEPGLNDLGLDGQTNHYAHEILLRPTENMMDGNASISLKEARHKEVLRHEIIHAFLFESGLECYSLDETLVDWIAVQFSKMAETFDDMNCI